MRKSILLAALALACAGVGYEPWIEPELHERNVSEVLYIVDLTPREWSRTLWYRALHDQVLPSHLVVFISRDRRACIVPQKHHTAAVIPGKRYQCEAGWRIESGMNAR